MEYEEITIKLPKPVLNFYRALLQFTKENITLEQLLVNDIISMLDAHLDTCLTDLIDPKTVKEAYDLAIILEGEP